MEPPPAPPLSGVASTIAPVSVSTLLPHLGYPDSVESSPRSRNTDSWDDQPLPTAAPKLRLMCSYGGHIVPRPHDKSLCYVGGDTRIVVADRHASLSDLSQRLSKTLLNSRPFTLKYQLPHEDLDSLISVTTDEDLENMVDEYDRVANSIKPSRLRVFLFPIKPDSAPSSIILDGSAKSEDWFLNALNASGFLPRGMSADSASVNCLLGLDDDVVSAGGGDGAVVPVGGGSGEAKSVVVGGNKQGQDIQSVPDSPMLDHTSSFGSTSSSPVLANLPPIRVHVDDNSVRVQDQKVGFEEQFSQLSVGGQKQEEGFSGVGVSTAATGVSPVVSGVPMGSQAVIGEYTNRVFAEEEYRKLGQLQQKPSGGLDLPSPDSGSSDSSVSNAISRQNQGKPLIYQDQIVQISPGTTRVLSNPVDPKLNTISDPNSRIHVQQQIQDFGYVMSSQFDPQQQPPPQQQQPQPQPQQFIHAGTHYVHHHPSGPVPMSSYYPIYPPQQQTHPHHHPHPHPQLEQQYPVYFVRQPQAYNMPTQQSGYGENIPSGRPQTPPPNPTLIPSSSPYNPPRNPPTSNPEITATNVYRTTNTAPQAGPQLVQVPSNQHPQQFMGFSQIHHPSQSIAPGSAAPGNYTYEFADPTHAQIYYTQPMAPSQGSQYQTMTSASGVVLSEASSEQHSRTS